MLSPIIMTSSRIDGPREDNDRHEVANEAESADSGE